MTSMTDVAKRLGATTAFTASQVAEGMVALGMMGFSPDEIESVIASVMNLSIVTRTDLAEASTIAANQLRIFGLEADQMGSVVDLLAATANGSAQSLTDLGESLKTAAPFAAQSGASLKDVSAALGVLANMGIRGSIAGTALAKSYKQMADPKIQQLLRTAYGVEVTDGAGNLKNMALIWKDLGKSLSSMGNAAQIAAITEIFGDRGALGGGQLTFNASAIDEFLQKLDDASGYVDSAAERVEGGLGGAFREFDSAIEAIQIALGDALAPSLALVTRFGATAIRTFASLVSVFREAVPVLAVLSGGIFATGVAMKAASVAMSALVLVKKLNLAATLDTIKTEIWYIATLARENVQAIAASVGNGVLATSFGVLKAAALACGGALKAVWAVLMAHPVVAVGAAVYALAKAFFYLYDKSLKDEMAGFVADADVVKKKLEQTKQKNEKSYSGIERDAHSLLYFEELSKASRMTESQIRECADALKDLSINGIDLGYSLDEATGKLVKTGAATASFQEQLNNKKRDDLKEQIKQLHSQIERRTNRASDLVADAKWYKLNKDVNADAADELLMQAADLQDQLEQLYRDYEAIGGEAVTPGLDLSKVTQIEKDLLSLKETNLDRELRINEEKKKSALEVVDAQLKLAESEREAVALNGGDVAKADAVIADLSRRRADISKMFDENRFGILASDARSAGFLDIDKDLQKRDAKRAVDERVRQQTQFLDALKETSPQAYASALQSAMAAFPEQIRQAAEALRLAQESAQGKASDGGVNVTDSEKARVDELRSVYEDIQRQRDEYSKRLAEMGEGAQRAVRSVTLAPTFSSRSLLAAMGRFEGNRFEKQTAESTKKLVDDFNRYWQWQQRTGGYLTFA